MKNTFFKIALNQAARVAGKPGRLLKLVAELAIKLYRSDLTSWRLSSLRERASVAGRMIAAYARGEYRSIPVTTLLALTAAALYFINPLDLIPDALVGIGLTDDLAVLTWVYRSAARDIKEFLDWEASLPLKV